MRKLHSWPFTLLHTIVRYGVPRGLVADAWLELAARVTAEANEAVLATANNETGPWPTCGNEAAE